MKAAMWYGRHGLKLKQYPDPGPPGLDAVISKMSRCGIGGIDREEYTGSPIFMLADGPLPGST